MEISLFNNVGRTPLAGAFAPSVPKASAQEGDGFALGAVGQGSIQGPVAVESGTGRGGVDEGGDFAGSGESAAGEDAARIAQEKAQAKVMQDAFNKECETCKNRKYQDGSNDPGVSFKSPQSIDPGQSASVVAGHEMEHVVHEQAKARQEGGEVVRQSVRLHGAFCPECGRYYVAGGTTETVTRHGGESHGNDKASEGGNAPLDITA